MLAQMEQKQHLECLPGLGRREAPGERLDLRDAPRDRPAAPRQETACQEDLHVPVAGQQGAAVLVGKHRDQAIDRGANGLAASTEGPVEIGQSLPRRRRIPVQEVYPDRGVDQNPQSSRLRIPVAPGDAAVAVSG
jgi:hypothetical protein